MILLNLNAQSHFSVNPVDLDIGRSRFERPKKKMLTADVGTLIPAYWTEILPGDTVQMSLSSVVQMSTILDPVMDNLYMDVNFFFVPMRLTWSHTKEFFGENTEGAWAPQTTYTVPQLSFTSSSGGAAVQSVADYMGIPVGVTGISVSALPFRAYGRVYDDWWRDENLVTPPTSYYGDSNQPYNASTPFRGGVPYKVAKFHDYFTSALPAPQRGSAVLIPFSGSGTVSISGSFPVTAASSIHSMGNTIQFADSSSTLGDNFIRRNGYIAGTPVEIGITSDTLSDYSHLTKSNLVTNVSGSGSVSGISSTTSVNDLRLAFQMQKWLEKSALFGGRYVSMLKAQFGVTSPDARLQRSEYLGGKRIPLNVQMVENNNASTASGAVPLGKLGAYSHTSDADDYFTHSFTEHGFLLCTVCFRYKHTYSQGVRREFLRKTMWDYYFPVFANIGNTPILRQEIYADGSASDDSVWGYQEAWGEYRYDQDELSGFFRPGVSGSLSSWHYGDYYQTAPTLSEGWIVEDKAPVDRTLAVPSSASVPQLLCDFLFKPVFTRAMPVYSIPGLIDHH